ncbi:hypothetical protein MBLNU459_g7600t1 [Dothideomycetes sp. NU459]
MAHSFTPQEVESFPEFPSQASELTSEHYAVKCETELTVNSHGPDVEAEVWFQTPPLDTATIGKIHAVQLLAETHDQGYYDAGDGGNWTWLEFALLSSKDSVTPRMKDGVELVWMSHYNRLCSKDYGWAEGMVFEAQHDMLRLIEEGNVIAVRLCSRFQGWSIAAKRGYLVIDVGHKTIEREPVEFGNVISEVTSLHNIFTEINVATNTAFVPSLPNGISRADSLFTPETRPLRVLSLDGGGVRGLSSLELLQAVMEKSYPGKKPCEVFDMIGGTSAGGLSAIMLGRLRMNIEDCIKAYKTFMQEVFHQDFFGKKTHFARTGSFYEAEVLERCIKKLIDDELHTKDAKLLDEDNPCKIFVMAVRKDAANNRGPVFLRSYQNPQEPSLLPDIHVWEAARATSAAPAYFKSIKVGDYDLVDGGLQANNPLGWLWTEVLGVYGPARASNCFLSIGTGIGKNEAIVDPGILGDHAVEKSFAGAATNSEIIHVLFRTLINAFAPTAQTKKYWRLNVGQEIPEWKEEKSTGWFVKKKEVITHLDNYEDVIEMDDVAQIQVLEDKTKEYIEAQKDAIQECANALKV